jgi:hypothetical protein
LLFGGTGVWTQGLVPTMWSLYHLCHTPTPLYKDSSLLNKYFIFD